MSTALVVEMLHAVDVDRSARCAEHLQVGLGYSSPLLPVFRLLLL